MTDEDRIRAAWDVCQWTPKYDGDNWKTLPVDYYPHFVPGAEEYDEMAEDPVIVFRRVDGYRGYHKWVKIVGKLGDTEIVVEELPYPR